MKMQNVKLNSFFVLLFCFIYALLRYVIFGPFDAVDIPIFIVNKAVSWGAVTFFLFSIFATSKNLNNAARDYRTFGFWSILCHALLTMSILDDRHYAKLFEDGNFSLMGQLGVLSGVLVVVMFLYYHYYFSNANNFTIVTKRITKVKLILIMTLAHLFFLGGRGWLKPEEWYGSMPPITLISFIIVLIALFYTYEWKWALNRQGE
jgi:hypothetical protein